MPSCISCIAPGLSQSSSVHYTAHGLICTSSLRLTLTSKNDLTSKPWTPISHWSEKFHYSPVSCKCSCKYPQFWGHFTRPTVNNIQQLTVVEVKAIHFCALSMTKAPTKPRGTKLSVHIKLTIKPLLTNYTSPLHVTFSAKCTKYNSFNVQYMPLFFLCTNFRIYVIKERWLGKISKHQVFPSLFNLEEIP